MRVEFSFCPACGRELEPREIEARQLPACPQCEFVAWPDPKVAVAMVVERSDGTVLAIRRGIAPGKGRWALPGGYMDADESPAQAARRECLEETHCTVEVDRLACVYHTVTCDGGLLVLAYIGHHLEGEPRPTGEAPELGWFAPDQLPELVFSSHRAAVDAWRSGRMDTI